MLRALRRGKMCDRGEAEYAKSGWVVRLSGKRQDVGVMHLHSRCALAISRGSCITSRKRNLTMSTCLMTETLWTGNVRTLAGARLCVDLFHPYAETRKNTVLRHVARANNSYSNSAILTAAKTT